MKTMSISIDESLHYKLKHNVPAKKISMFVSQAIKKELDAVESELRAAYTEAEQDSARQKELKDWDAIDV
jgi:hypothetical protein